jgi:hypothetical protein
VQGTNLVQHFSSVAVTVMPACSVLQRQLGTKLDDSMPAKGNAMMFIQSSIEKVGQPLRRNLHAVLLDLARKQLRLSGCI